MSTFIFSTLFFERNIATMKEITTIAINARLNENREM